MYRCTTSPRWSRVNCAASTRQTTKGPYLSDPISPELAKAFAQAATVNGQKVPAISWADMSLEADPQNDLFYGGETLARKIAAFRITSQGIQTVWKKTQTTTE